MSFTFVLVLMFFVVFVLAVMVAFVLKKSSQHKTKEFIQNEQQSMREALLKKRKKLNTHHKELYQQVTDAMTFDVEDAVTYLKISGFIYNEQRKPIVAFQRIERGMYEKGHLIAVTKKQEFLFEFHGLEVIFYVDSELFGRIDKKGQLFDSHEELIGKATHPLSANFSIDHFKRSHPREKDRRFPLILNGREVAMINVAPNYGQIPECTTVSDAFDIQEFGTPIISVSDTPDTTEEIWLLAFAIFETAYHGKQLVP